MRIRTLLLSILILTCLACWQRQEHDILTPEIPHYTMSGYTIDIDDTLCVIPHTPISLTAFTMLYDVTFDPVSIQSDSSGYYRIDSVFPGDYILTAERGGFYVFSERLSIAHNDRVYNPGLPSPLVSDYSYFSSVPNIGPITFVDGILWALGAYPISEAVKVPAILKLVVDHGLIVPISYYPVDDTIGADTFGYARGLFYLCKSAHVTTISATDGSVITDWLVDEPLTGLTWTDAGFWTTHENCLQFRGLSLTTVESSIETSADRLKELAKSGGYFWTYDRDRYLILRLSSEGNILTSYRPVDAEAGSWINVSGLDFHSEGQMWINGNGKLYQFFID